MHECTLTQEFLTPKTVEGHGTEAMSPSKRQASTLILQSIEEMPQLNEVEVERPQQPSTVQWFEFGVAFY